MNDPWLLLDVSSLAYRAFYSMGDLSHEGISTGVPFGIFRTLADLMELYSTKRVVFCFDGGHAERKKIFPAYKQRRRKNEEENEELVEARESVREQLTRLESRFLPQMGFENIFRQPGYEADDVIAQICKTYTNDRFVIVSSDEDLFQLLEDGRVWIWSLSKKKPFTASAFHLQYNIHPGYWAAVKSIAGCSSDGIPGIHGIGEKKAVQFLLGKMRPSTNTYRDILSFKKSHLYERNLRLVELPFPGTQKFRLCEDHLTSSGWERVMDSLGMSTLRDRTSGRKRKFKHIEGIGHLL